MSEPTVTVFPLRERIAEEVRVLLARRRISASELARRIGATQPYISRRLTGETALDVDDLERIAAVLDVEVVDLLPRANEGRVVTTAGGPLNGRLARSPVRPIYRRRRPTTHPNGGPRPEPSRPVPAVAATQRRPMLASAPGQRITGRARAATA